MCDTAKAMLKEVDQQIANGETDDSDFASVGKRMGSQSIRTAEIGLQPGCLGIAERLSFCGRRSGGFVISPLAETPRATRTPAGGTPAFQPIVGCAPERQGGNTRDPGLNGLPVYTLAIF